MFATDGRISSAQALQAIRDVRIRRNRACHVWLAIFQALSTDVPAPVKVKSTARYVRLERKKVRRALRMLEDFGYIVCVTRPTQGTAGEYVLGPAVFRTGGRTAPVQAPETLPLFDEAA